jgi:hypothetical protein
MEVSAALCSATHEAYIKNCIIFTSKLVAGQVSNCEGGVSIRSRNSQPKNIFVSPDLLAHNQPVQKN